MQAIELALIKPNESYLTDISAYRQEFINSGDEFHGDCALQYFDDALEWLEYNRSLENHKIAESSWIEFDQYVCVRKDEERVVGMINYRRANDKQLSEYAGEIGFSVRPSERNKGYAKEMLKQHLGICAERGIKSVVLTCGKENTASQKTIKACGGAFERYSAGDGNMERYIIELAPALNSYQKQAVVWDWDGYDDTPEYEYWCGYAEKFGNKVLIPMCAHGQRGAYMAKRGFRVTAFDITSEMIEEGKKRYGKVPGLELVVADILELNLQEKSFDFAFIAGNGDLHLLQSVNDVEKAFLSMHKHIKNGGCLALELTLPSHESWSYPKQIFHPRVPNYSDKKVWKENESSYNAAEKRHYINQTVYIEDANGITSFTQLVCLQYYEREVIIESLRKCGFVIQNEFCNRQKEPWAPQSGEWIVQAIRQ